jgi:hypothetical protein
MVKRIGFFIISLLFCIAIAGCGNNPASGSASKKEPALADQEAKGSIYSEYLSVSDVEQASGLTGLKTEEEGVTLRFTDNDGAVVYEARFYGADFYETEVGGNRDYYTDVPGIGEKAAICIPDSPYRLVFSKGDRCVMTQTLAKNADGEWMLSEEQLIAVAKSIASKLPD